jgi:hypothetical protein
MAAILTEPTQMGGWKNVFVLLGIVTAAHILTSDFC